MVNVKNGLLYRVGRKIPLCSKIPSTQHCLCYVSEKYRKMYHVIFYQVHGEILKPLMCIYHINEKKNDNCIKNLEDLTWGENIAVSYNFASHLRKQIVVISRDRKMYFVSMNSTARALNINPDIISMLISNKTRLTTNQATGKKCTVHLFTDMIQFVQINLSF